LKAVKKGLFLKYAQLSGFIVMSSWRASFETDAEEIRSAIGRDVEILCAPDLPPKTILPDFDPAINGEAVRHCAVRLCVQARQKEKLALPIRAARNIAGSSVELDVVGPIEDKEVLEGSARPAARKLPSNVKLNVLGPMTYPETLDRMKSAHFFVLPTLTENFGYVFIEALACGCPLLISDRTVWGEIVERGSGWTFRSRIPETWSSMIARCVDWIRKNFLEWRKRRAIMPVEWLANPEIEEASAKLLERASGTDVERTRS
jgi:hypothetical protein